MAGKAETDDMKALAQRLVAIIHAALPDATLGQKWNAPSFAVAGRDLITLNLPPKGGQVRVIFHRGAKAKDTDTGARLIDEPEGRLTWPSDQRAIACFKLGEDIDGDWLSRVCQNWVRAAALG
ncbi:DUF1801 domain-containing protein [uncultured Maritimibacter sp.]|uniref:DUF1801 domain-containing protein n=1 Tax=uncultured Maritimibacter sp. TaxID=991866 RepID=UPI00259515EF|nr:DUF1801 domain-containing protein [uncultured Maritimibacter sp.]